MATSQPLAFAELGFGGILLVSAVKNIPLKEVFKHGVGGQPEEEASKGAAGGLEVPTLSGGPPSGPAASPPNGSVLLESQVAKELEGYLKRPLSSKERGELKSLNSKGKL